MNNENALSRILGKFSGAQKFILVSLRVIVGWHFLYEGYVKIVSEGWSSAGYLNASPGPFAGMFHAMAGSSWMVSAVDIIMSWGLTLIGITLILGLFTRLASVAAIFFLILFYLSNPPWIGVQFMAGEGSYMIVNKNLVELAAVMVLLVFPTGVIWGFDRIFVKE